MLAEPGLNRGRFAFEVNLRRAEVAVSDTPCKPFAHSIELSLEPFRSASVRRAVLGAPQALCEEELQPALMAVAHD
jgi:hypothetical protein